nr:ATP-binding protein [Mycobacterium asiaticum]
MSLASGLNVVVGPRGAGKTSFLELLRHAVGAQHADQNPAAQRQRQAFLDAVLGAGEVIVDVETDTGGRHIVVDARGGGQRHDLSRSVLVLGQNELEEIASDAPSRLNLLDLRTATVAVVPDRSAAAEITGEIFDTQQQLEDRSEEAKKRSRLVADRELLSSQEVALLGANTAKLSEQRDRLRDAEERVIQTGQNLERIAAAKNELSDLIALQVRLIDRTIAAADRASVISAATTVSLALADAARLSQDAIAALNTARTGLIGIEAQTTEENITAREIAAPIREELERAEAGLGQITAQLRNINAALRSLDENDALVSDLKTHRSILIQQRQLELNNAEQAEESLYETRAAVARSTTSQVANNVVVVVDHLADASEFRSFLQDSLRGTGTRSALIDTVADRLLPRQLLEMVEDRDFGALAAVADIAVDRAQKLIENLDNRELLQGLARMRLTDRVDFRLKDGSVDKSVDELSTGQKCAVTLPIVLSEKQRTLILDQPEDHLDNAYLVKNIVAGLTTRTLNGAQTIVATHNANIPVLGSADNVVVLTSDGKTGAVEVEGPFDADEIVDRITRLMEGGRDAFARRSAFYAEHGGLE